jgi:hypothetical protein
MYLRKGKYLSTVILGTLLFCGFFGAYMVALPPFCDFNIQNDDGLDHACSIANGYDLFHQHRIFYTKIADLLYRVFYSNVVPPVLAATLALRLESALFGAAGVLLFFLFVFRLTSSRLSSFLAASALGASRGYFLFSSVAESYIPGAATILLCFFVFERARRSMKPHDFILLGAANFFAITIRQTNGLLIVPLFFWIFLGPDWKRRFRLFLYYAVVMTFITFFTYLLVYVRAGRPFDSSEFFHWMKSYGYFPELTRWEYLRWVNSRNSLIRILYCFGIGPTMTQVWMVQEPLGSIGLWIDGIVQAVLILTTVVLGVATALRFRAVWRTHREILVVALLWFGIHEIFYTYEIPYLLYSFTVPTIFVVFLLIYLGTDKAQHVGKVVQSARVSLPVLLLASTLLTVSTVNGTLLWDAYAFTREKTAVGDFVITRDVYEGSILSFLLGRQAYVLDYWENRKDRTLESDSLKDLLKQARKRGSRVFLKNPRNKPKFEGQHKLPFSPIRITDEMISKEEAFFSGYTRREVRDSSGALWGWELLER